MRLTTKPLLVLALSVGTVAASATGAFAYGSGSFGSELKTVSYINSDGGKNADVTDPSNCFTPDQYDMQAFSTVAGNPGANNVHNDACFLDSSNRKVGKNIGASFQASGTGYISACPDPDRVVTNGVVVSNGPAVAILRDLNNDGRNDSCYQSSFQETGKAGDFEYHARVNSVNTAGEQKVVWGADADADGRIDNFFGDSIKVDWSADGKSGSSFGW